MIISFSRVYSNSCCSCSFEPEIIKNGRSSHKMYSNNILNFQESTTILNACTKKVCKLIECTFDVSTNKADDIIITAPSAQTGYDTKSIFKQSLTGLNSECSFSLTRGLTKAEEPSLPYYLPIAEARMVGFIPFPRVLVLCEMQSVSSRIWTRVAVSISYDDDQYTTGRWYKVFESSGSQSETRQLPRCSVDNTCVFCNKIGI